MPIQTATSSGLNLISQNLPIFDLGAWLYWESLMGSRAMLRGGSVTPSDDFDYQYVGTAVDDYTHYHPGRARFEEVAFTSPFPPADGHFVREQDTVYNASDPRVDSGRGPFTIESGLTVNVLIPAPYNHILNLGGGDPTESVLVTNLAAGPRRMWRNEQSSDLFQTIWSILIRRNNGGKVDSSIIELGITANNPAGGGGPDLGTGSTKYDKIREDGWYRVWRILPLQALAPLLNYYVEWKAGVTNATFEAPQLEIYDHINEIDEPTAPIMNPAGLTNNNRGKHCVRIDGNYDVSEFGWMGCTIIPLTDAADLAIPGISLGEIINWEIDDSNRIRIFYDSITETIRFRMERAASTEINIGIPQASVLQGVPLGIVATWGARAGSRYSALFVNGSEIGTDDTFTPPSGTGSIYIGSDADAQADPANVKVQQVVIGDRALVPSDAMVLSRWLETKILSPLGKKGD